MKRLSYSFVGAIALAIFCLPVQRAFSVPFHDPFDYPDGSGLSGLTNSEGDVWGLCGSHAPDVVITNINFSYPGLAYSSNYAIFYGGGLYGTNLWGSTERIAVNPPVVTPTSTNAYNINNGTIYYSLLFMVENMGGLDTGGSFICGFNNLSGPQSGLPSVVCGRIHLHQDVADPNLYEIGIGKAPISRLDASFLPTPYKVGDTNFVVVSYTADGNHANSNDVAQIWVNPDPSSFGAAVPPPADATNYSGYDFGSASATSIQSFVFRQGNLFIPMLIADELRIGPTWACVTPLTNAPVPTPVNLSIQLSDTTNTIISWSTNAACFALQSAPTLTDSWTTVYGNFAVVGNQFMITNPPSGDSVFYRLKEF